MCERPCSLFKRETGDVRHFILHLDVKLFLKGKWFDSLNQGASEYWGLCCCGCGDRCRSGISMGNILAAQWDLRVDGAAHRQHHALTITHPLSSITPPLDTPYTPYRWQHIP